MALDVFYTEASKKSGGRVIMSRTNSVADKYSDPSNHRVCCLGGETISDFMRH